MAATLIEPAPAKINLALHVTGRRADGYHSLESLVVFADLCDEVGAMPADADSLEITGPFAAGLSAGASNLVLRAAAAFRARWPEAVPEGLAFRLTKNLPVMAGLGGGSADAAAVLRILARQAATSVPRAALNDLAATLGADVPACLVSRPCEVRGIGEIVRPLRTFPEAYVVLVNPLRPVVTADVFRRMERHAFPPLPALPEGLDRPAMLALWLEETRNDLDAPARALVPEIGPIEDRLSRLNGCMLARMSGSGGTVFGLFGSGSLAHQAAHDLRGHWPDYWVAAAPVIGVGA